ncbi:MAG: hypothetical protein ACRC0E_05545 [Soonwooa sp.]
MNASVSNIFASCWKSDIFYADNTQHYNNYWDGRSFRLSVNYTFGNKKVRNERNIKFDEKDRAQ